jgi:hypothetical protein
MLREAARAAAEGRAIGLIHCPEWTDVDGEQPLIDWTVLAAAASAGIDFTDLEPDQAAPVVVPSPEYGELLGFEHPVLRPERVAVHVSAAVGTAPELDTATTETGAEASLLHRGDALLAGLGVLAVGATAAVAALLQPDALPAAAAASLVVWAAGAAALLGRRLAARAASL